MAYSAQGERLTEAHRLAQLQVSRGVLAQLLALWPLLSVDDLDATRAAWLEASVVAVTNGAVQSVAVARRYFEAFRAAEVGGLLPATVADAGAGVVVGDVARVASRLESAGPIAVKRATAAGLADPAKVALSRVLGVGQREVLQPGRDVVAEMIAADKRAKGYARVTSGNACAFCLMLAGRGPVYSEASGRFEAHDACGCSVEPEFDAKGTYNLPPSTHAAADQWDAYKRDRAEHPEKYDGLFDGKTHGASKGEGRSASEANALGFRRFVEGRGPSKGSAAGTARAAGTRSQVKPTGKATDEWTKGAKTPERRAKLHQIVDRQRDALGQMTPGPWRDAAEKALREAEDELAAFN